MSLFPPETLLLPPAFSLLSAPLLPANLATLPLCGLPLLLASVHPVHRHFPRSPRLVFPSFSLYLSRLLSFFFFLIPSFSSLSVPVHHSSGCGDDRACISHCTYKLLRFLAAASGRLLYVKSYYRERRCGTAERRIRPAGGVYRLYRMGIRVYE